MNKAAYIEKLLKARTMRADVQSASDARLLSILKKSHMDLTELLSLYGEDSVTYANYYMRREEISKIIRNMTLGIDLSTKLSIKNASENVVNLYSKSAIAFAASKGFEYDFKSAFLNVPKTATSNTLNRLWLDGKDFSDRIWSMNSYAQESVKQIIGAGVARGQSAVSMSKSLREYLLDPVLRPGNTWTTAIDKSVSGRGTIHYNALRLARSEINNSYRESLIICNDKNPVTLGVKWNTSASHVVPDICDVWATVDEYGLGAGVYPAGETPIDHPNGLCYLTEVLRPASEWDNPKEEFERSMLSKDEVLSSLSGASESDLNAAWRQYENMNDLLNTNSKLEAA